MNEGRSQGIDYLRGFWILLIFISHSSQFEVIGSQGIWGAAGVTVFFILSGFLSCQKYASIIDDARLWKECIHNVGDFLESFIRSIL